jgi:hypothetical protein
MAQDPPTGAGAGAASELGARLEAIGRSIGERESSRADHLRAARLRLGEIRGQVNAALRRFHTAVSESGAAHLRVELSPIRIDEKHLRAVEFEISRGRHRGIFVAKDRGEITLVGPFRTGKTEGPCRSLPFEAGPEFEALLGDFLAEFLEEAATP